MQHAQKIGEIIERLIEERGVTIKQAMKECGLATSFVGNLKSGSMPSADKLKVVADYLGVTVDWLLTGEQAAYEPTTYKEDTKMSNSINDIFFNALKGICDKQGLDMFDLSIEIRAGVGTVEMLERINELNPDVAFRFAKRLGVSVMSFFEGTEKNIERVVDADFAKSKWLTDKEIEINTVVSKDMDTWDAILKSRDTFNDLLKKIQSIHEHLAVCQQNILPELHTLLPKTEDDVLEDSGISKLDKSIAETVSSLSEMKDTLGELAKNFVNNLKLYAKSQNQRGFASGLSYPTHPSYAEEHLLKAFRLLSLTGKAKVMDAADDLAVQETTQPVIEIDSVKSLIKEKKRLEERVTSLEASEDNESEVDNGEVVEKKDGTDN